jgi:hypothetical protein
MKVGTTRSLWRYDAVARHTLYPAKLRYCAISCCTSCIPVVGSR